MGRNVLGAKRLGEEVVWGKMTQNHEEGERWQVIVGGD